MALLATVLYVPFVKRMFGFGTLHWNDLFLCMAAGMVLLYGLQGGKKWISPLGRAGRVEKVSGRPAPIGSGD